MWSPVRLLATENGVGVVLKEIPEVGDFLPTHDLSGRFLNCTALPYHFKRFAAKISNSCGGLKFSIQ